MSERGYKTSGDASNTRIFKVGDYVIKMSGDYRFHGIVVSAFEKLSGAVRYVVENPDGVLHIFSGRDIGTSKQAAHAIQVERQRTLAADDVIKKTPVEKLIKKINPAGPD